LRVTSPFDSDLSDRARSALDEFIDAARQAGEIAMRDFRRGRPSSVRVRLKQGGSPVTDADLAIDRYLSERLRASFPDAGWISEETPDDPTRVSWASVVIVDPIDGTRAFLAGDPRWTVSIALAHDGRPIAGVVHAPALDETYAAALGRGASRNGAPIRASARKELDGALVGGPMAMIGALAKAAGVEFVAVPRVPSLALRLVRVAAGAPDVGIGSPGAHDWDIAAADAILREAGARLAEADGRPPRYNNEAATRRGALVASGAGLSAALAAAAGRAFGERAR
jgi:myo-inositol-1(or 4)-monophosphatase